MPRGKSSYDSILKVRCTTALKARLERLVQKRGHGDMSDIVREAIFRWCDKEEDRLNLTALPAYTPAHRLNEETAVTAGESPPPKIAASSK